MRDRIYGGVHLDQIDVVPELVHGRTLVQYLLVRGLGQLEDDLCLSVVRIGEPNIRLTWKRERDVLEVQLR